MERLSDFAADIINDLYENSDWYGDYSLIEAAINRLAAYEETGLEPEAVEHLKLASMGKAIAEIKSLMVSPLTASANWPRRTEMGNSQSTP